MEHGERRKVEELLENNTVLKLWQHAAERWKVRGLN
jgi:hypothetical protein